MSDWLSANKIKISVKNVRDLAKAAAGGVVPITLCSGGSVVAEPL